MAPEQLHILLVLKSTDDIASIRRALSTPAMGITLTVASDLSQAREHLAEVTPDLVIADARQAEGEEDPDSLLDPRTCTNAPVILLLPEERGNGLAIEAVARGVILELQRAVTAQRGLTEQLRQARQMNALGQLASSIAHSFNNHLGIVLGNVDLIRDQLEMEMPPNSRLLADLQVIETSARRAAGLSQQLLSFSRHEAVSGTPLDLGQVLVSIEQMARQLVSPKTQVVVLPQPQLWRIGADSNQITQLALSLVANAAEAMPDGGTLTIEVTNQELDEEYVVRYPLARRGPHVAFSVSDTGSGIDEHLRQQIFEPFFSTKPDGPGAGLGLAVVADIVKRLGGHVTVESQLGAGSTFRACFPTLAEPGSPPTYPGHPPTTLRRRSERRRETIAPGLLAGHRRATRV